VTAAIADRLELRGRFEVQRAAVFVVVDLGGGESVQGCKLGDVGCARGGTEVSSILSATYGSPPL
jgi:hypothetical protein